MNEKKTQFVYVTMNMEIMRKRGKETHNIEQVFYTNFAIYIFI